MRIMKHAGSMVLTAAALLPAVAGAVPVTATFSAAVESIGEYEYGTAQPIPPGATPLLPYFAGATTVTGSYSYDTDGAIDLDPSPTASQFVLPGSFTLALPGRGISVTAAGTIGVGVGFGALQISGNAISSSSGDFGGATPFAVSVVLYGTGLVGDALPTAAPAFSVVNAYYNLDGVDPARNFFILAYPVPEPGTAATLAAGLGAMGMLTLRRRRRASH